MTNSASGRGGNMTSDNGPVGEEGAHPNGGANGKHVDEGGGNSDMNSASGLGVEMTKHSDITSDSGGVGEEVGSANGDAGSEHVDEVGDKIRTPPPPPERNTTVVQGPLTGAELKKM